MLKIGMVAANQPGPIPPFPLSSSSSTRKAGPTISSNCPLSAMQKNTQIAKNTKAKLSGTNKYKDSIALPFRFSVALIENPLASLLL
jgi:hypothetical protein